MRYRCPKCGRDAGADLPAGTEVRCGHGDPEARAFTLMEPVRSKKEKSDGR